MPNDFCVIAIIAAYNEEDIISQVVEHLIREGVQVYLIDDGSSDRTVDVVRPYVGRGVLDIERFVASGDDGQSRKFNWEQILRRKEELATQLDADWFIHQDADEFRESPWSDLRLSEAIRLVDRLGYNAIDFRLFNFHPTDADDRSVDDIRDVFRHYEPAAWFDAIQIRCWRRTRQKVDLASSGGHDVTFDGRRVFPIRFVLRHYPFRSQAHGERKVSVERRGRFVDAERQRGWHIQYDGIGPGHQFQRRATELTMYEPDMARVDLQLRHRGVESLEIDAKRASERAAAAEASNGLLSARIAACESQIAVLESQNNDQKIQITAFESQHNDQKAQIAAFESQHNDQKVQVAALESQNNDQTIQIAALESQGKADKFRLTVLESQVVDLQSEIQTSESRRRDAETRATRLGDQLIDLHAAFRLAGTERAIVDENLRNVSMALRKLEVESAQETDALRHEVDALLNSGSWRVTRPLRALWRLLQRWH